MDQFRPHRYRNFTIFDNKKIRGSILGRTGRICSPKFSHVLSTEALSSSRASARPARPALKEIEHREIKPWRCSLLHSSMSFPYNTSPNLDFCDWTEVNFMKILHLTAFSAARFAKWHTRNQVVEAQHLPTASNHVPVMVRALGAQKQGHWHWRLQTLFLIHASIANVLSLYSKITQCNSQSRQHTCTY
jgi:hypothetical protein